MKPKVTKHKILKEQMPLSAAEKARVIRRATQITLKEYSKTFADLARYDRTEKING